MLKIVYNVQNIFLKSKVVLMVNLVDPTPSIIQKGRKITISISLL